MTSIDFWIDNDRNICVAQKQKNEWDNFYVGLSKSCEVITYNFLLEFFAKPICINPENFNILMFFFFAGSYCITTIPLGNIIGKINGKGFYF